MEESFASGKWLVDGGQYLSEMRVYGVFVLAIVPRDHAAMVQG